ncbi:hypothetical protein IC575_000434 [Cucumis melo]|uniref:Uncharacterized protein LOC103495585 n=1 Tax=Cucumis melo TaxID=3656 RepID=A0A1S3C0F7_CUCME|nr:vascular-related unknown protein 1-like [Cucumis melo]
MEINNNNNNNATPQAPDSPPENSSAAGAEEQEESGWTDYLEDYFNSELVERESSFLCSSIGSCSNWDDLNNISYPNYDINYNINVGNVNYDDFPKSNNLTFKKTRTQKIFEDDDSLQDTATSPIHSPKVVDLKVRTSQENPRFDDHITIFANSTGSGRQMGKYYSNKEKSVYSAEKKGLCLLPFSMLLNYHN